jgi:WD40 repeat protein
MNLVSSKFDHYQVKYEQKYWASCPVCKKRVNPCICSLPSLICLCLNKSRMMVSLQILAVLSQDGIARFINTDSCKLLFDIGSIEDGIMNIAISPTGHHVVAVTENGRLNIYSAQCLSEEINKVRGLCQSN